MTASHGLAVAQKSLVEEARRLLPEAILLRRELHRIPEIGLHLPKTQRAIVAALEALGLKPNRGKASTSVWVDFHGNHAGNKVLLRADMDALPLSEPAGPYASDHPGSMHACGHDAHSAILVLAARLLMARRHLLHGSVRLMFQPGEEGHFGAEKMIEEGVLEGVSAGFALHVAPQLPAGVVAVKAGATMAGADVFEVTYRGEGGHGSTPHLTNDPIQAACAFVQGVNSLVARRINPFDPAIVSVTSLGSTGGKSVLADKVVLEGTFRTFNPGARESLLKNLRQLAQGVAVTHCCEMQMTVGRGYPAATNDARMAALVLSAARKVVAPARCIELKAPQMAADDFAFVLQRIPGAFWLLGACPEATTTRKAAPVHSPHFRISEESLATGAAVHAQVVLDYLREPSSLPLPGEAP